MGQQTPEMRRDATRRTIVVPGHVFLLSIDGFVRTSDILCKEKTGGKRLLYILFLEIEEGGRFKRGKKTFGSFNAVKEMWLCQKEFLNFVEAKDNSYYL